METVLPEISSEFFQSFLTLFRLNSPVGMYAPALSVEDFQGELILTSKMELGGPTLLHVSSLHLFDLAENGVRLVASFDLNKEERTITIQKAGVSSNEPRKMDNLVHYHEILKYLIKACGGYVYRFDGNFENPSINLKGNESLQTLFANKMI